jgi:hypothetical protein
MFKDLLKALGNHEKSTKFVELITNHFPDYLRQDNENQYLDKKTGVILVLGSLTQYDDTAEILKDAEDYKYLTAFFFGGDESEIPFGVKSSDSYEDVIKKAGPPTYHNINKTGTMIEKVNDLHYCLGKYKMVVSFDPDTDKNYGSIGINLILKGMKFGYDKSLEKVIDLTTTKDSITGQLELKCWHKYIIPESKRKNSLFPITFQDTYTDNLSALQKEDLFTLDYLLNNIEKHQKLILEKLLSVYPQWQKEYGYSPEDAKLYMPNVESINDFYNIIELINVRIIPISNQNQYYIGYEFNTNYDIEHGMGCMFLGDEIVDFGLAESGFMLWIATKHKESNNLKGGNEFC